MVFFERVNKPIANSETNGLANYFPTNICTDHQVFFDYLIRRQKRKRKGKNKNKKARKN